MLTFPSNSLVFAVVDIEVLNDVVVDVKVVAFVVAVNTVVVLLKYGIAVVLTLYSSVEIELDN
jgi:hypothetical protein